MARKRNFAMLFRSTGPYTNPHRDRATFLLTPSSFCQCPVRCSVCGFGRGRCLRIGPSGFNRAVVVRGVVVGGVVVRERVVVLEVGVGEGRKKRTV